MTTPTIREIRDGDIERVIALWHDAGVARPWNDLARDIAFALRSAHATILVAEWHGRVSATAMVGDDGHRGWVYYVAVAPDRQRQGLGSAIMAAAELWLAQRGIWKLNLLIREDNVLARQFYERLGFSDTRATCFQKVLQHGR